MALLVAILAFASHALAENGGYTLMRAISQSSGAIAAQSGDYQLKAVVGQPFAGTSTVQNMRLGAGYWYWSDETSPPIIRKQYLPLIKR